MKKFAISILICTINVFVIASFMPHVSIENIWSAFGVAILLAFLNTFLNPILQFFALPFTLITLGLFTWVVNACIMLLDDKFIKGFKIDSFFWALLFTIVLSFFNTFVESRIFNKNKKPLK